MVEEGRNKKWKYVLRGLLMLAFLVYLVFSMVRGREVRNTSICRGMDVTVLGEENKGFITPEEVVRLLKKARLYPVGAQVCEISTEAIVEGLRRNEFINDVTAYVTADSRVRVVLEQRLPLLRVMDDKGDSYYVDREGRRMLPKGYSADLVVVTGSFSDAYLRKYLLNVGRYIEQHRFWNRQVEQLRVMSDSTLVMYPRVGVQQVLLGRPDSLERKFSNLKAFYKQVLPEVGWNTYTEVDLSYPNQIIGRFKQTVKD